MEAEDLTSPYTCMTSALSIEPSPQPPFLGLVSELQSGMVIGYPVQQRIRRKAGTRVYVPPFLTEYR